MANRMDIELTSARDDETYTWRAAGARQPRGVVPVSVLPPHCKVGDVLRAEVEVELDGITVLSVLPPRQKNEDGANRIEYIGPQRTVPGVTTILAGRGGGRDLEGDRRRPGDRGERRPRRERTRREGERPERRERDRTERRQASAERSSPGPRRERGGPRAEADGRSETANRPDTGIRGQAGGRPRGGARPHGERDGAPGRGGLRRVVSRFEPGTAHREELFATLTPEQRPIAERLAIGGLPAVRKALSDEQQRARSEGRPAVSGDPIIAIAEQLMPDVKSAVWLDRAEAALARADEITLRDLRTTVVGAAPRDDAGRDLERQLREALDRRVTKLRQDWEQHLVQALDDSRVLQALRLSSRPPEPTAPFPASLVMRLAEAAGKAMTSETAPDRWLSLLEAAAQSPVRRQIKPLGIPTEETGEVERQARAAASRIPALGRLLGMPIPPPPHRVPGARTGTGSPPGSGRRAFSPSRQRTGRSASRQSPPAATTESGEQAGPVQDETAAEPAIEPAVEPSAEPAAEPAIEPAAEPPAETAAEPAEEPAEMAVDTPQEGRTETPSAPASIASEDSTEPTPTPPES